MTAIPKTTIQKGDTVQIKIRADGYSSRLYVVQDVTRKNETDFVLVDLSSPMIKGVNANDVRLIAKAPQNVTQSQTDAAGQSSRTGTVKTNGSTENAEIQALRVMLSELALLFDGMVSETIDEQHRLVGEIAALLDENWSLWVELSRTRIQARDWRTVAENTVRDAALVEKERNELRRAANAPQTDTVRDALAKINVDILSPMEAMTELMTLKRLANMPVRNVQKPAA